LRPNAAKIRRRTVTVDSILLPPENYLRPTSQGRESAAVLLDHKSVAAIYGRGLAYSALKQYELAIQDFDQVLRVDPDFSGAYNELAWLLATAEKPSVRDGPRTIKLATRACGMTDWKNLSYLDTLAAAYARAGDFAQTVEWEQRATASQDAVKQTRLERLQLYRAGKAWPED